MKAARAKRRGKGFAVKLWRELPLFSFVGARMRSFLSPRESEALSCYHIKLSRGGSISPAYHKKAFELIWILEGGGVAQLGGRRVKLRRGDSLLIQPPTPHGFEAGPAGMAFLAVLSPRVDSKTDYYSCHGETHAQPRVHSGRLIQGRAR